MIRLGLIGCGNAGGQIADLAKERKDIPGIVINTSEKDIDNIKNITTFKVGDNRGAGKSRKRAKDFVKQMIKQLLNQDKFKNHIDDNDVIAVLASTGGGTGSGISVMLTDLLSVMYPDKRFILVHVLPSLKESLASQQNTIEYLQEMNNINVTYMSYDNGRKDHLSTNVMLKNMNEEIVEDLAVIRGDYLISTPFTSIDEQDLTRILEVPGRLMVHRVYDIKEKDVENQDIEQLLLDTIVNNEYMTELQPDRKVKKMGVVENLTDKLANKVDSNLDRFKDEIGHPIEGFEHMAIIKPGTNYKNRLIVMSSGLSLPENRIEKINERIQEILDELEKQKQEESSILSAIKTSELDNLRAGRGDDGVDEIDIDDFLGKY
jgi:chorismate mutase